MVQQEFEFVRIIEDQENPYDLLGLEKTASSDEIKKAYFKTVKKYSPELYPEEFKRVRRAYDTLRFDDSRARYDILLFNVFTGPIGYRELEGKTESLVKLQKEIQELEKQGIDSSQETKKKLINLYKARSMVYLRKNLFKEAIDEWLKLTDLDSKDKESRRNLINARNRRAQALIEEENYKEAEKEWLALKELGFEAEPIIHNLAISATQQSDSTKENKYWPEVLEVWNSRLKTEPDNELLKHYILETHKYFGGRFLNADAKQKGQRKSGGLFEKPAPSMVETPKQRGGQSKLDLALACMEQKNWPQAIAFLEECLSQKPEDIKILNHLGWANLNSGDSESAFQIWNKAYKLDPKNEETKKNIVDGRLLVARNLKKERLFSPALVNLKNVLRLAPKNAAVYLEIGEIYYLQGDLISAMRQYEKAIELDPRNKQIKQVIKQLKIKLR